MVPPHHHESDRNRHRMERDHSGQLRYRLVHVSPPFPPPSPALVVNRNLYASGRVGVLGLTAVASVIVLEACLFENVPKKENGQRQRGKRKQKQRNAIQSQSHFLSQSCHIPTITHTLVSSPWFTPPGSLPLVHLVLGPLEPPALPPFYRAPLDF